MYFATCINKKMHQIKIKNMLIQDINETLTL